jgi:hypothetical protein
MPFYMVQLSQNLFGEWSIEAPDPSIRQREKMAIETDVSSRHVWRRQNCGLECIAIADKNYLLLRPRHRGVKQGPIEQTASDDWDNHAAGDP